MNHCRLIALRKLPGFHSLRNVPAIGNRISHPTLTRGDFGILYITHESDVIFYNTLERLKNFEHDGLYKIEVP